MGKAFHLSRADRRVLAVLVAYIALLMPALLPFGAQPAAPIHLALATHAHAGDIDPTAPHDHGGKHEHAPACAACLVTLGGSGMVPPAPAPTTAVVTPVEPIALARAVPSHAQRYSPARPRGPPAEA